MSLANKMTLVSLILSTSVLALGQNNTSSTTLETPTPKKNFGLLLGLSYSSNMYAKGQIDRATSSTLIVNPSYTLSDKLTTALKTSVTQELNHQKNTMLSNTSLGLSHKTATLSDSILWRNRISLIAPTSEKSQNVDRLHIAFGAGTMLSYKNENPVLPFNLVGSVGIQRNIHEYNLNADGANNSQYFMYQGLSAGVELTEKLSLSLAANYNIAISYANTNKYSFDTSVDISYTLANNLSLSAGVSNGGNALKLNGIDSNISFLNENTSEVNLGVEYTY